jgi:hypothetical protein
MEQIVIARLKKFAGTWEAFVSFWCSKYLLACDNVSKFLQHNIIQ